MNNGYAVLLIGIMSFVTILLRVLPFVLFHKQKKTPEILVYLGNVLPYAIMGMLVVFCLKSVTFVEAPFGILKILASVVVVLLHLWKRNTRIRIVSGTIIYMLLVQTIFSSLF